MKKYLSNPRTTIGGVVALVSLSMFWAGKLDHNQFLSVLAVCGIWIGVTAADSKTNKPQS